MEQKKKARKCDYRAKPALQAVLLKVCCLCCWCFTSAISVLAQLPSDARLFNDGWAFHRGDLDPSSLSGSSNDTLWQAITLPQDWSIKGPFSPRWASATGYLPGGIGWYRKTFKIGKAETGLRQYIYFEGVYKNSVVWLNGHLLGRRPNGFVSFYYDMTPYLKENGVNVLLVKADHTDFADSRWYTGSGIYRNVFKVSAPSVHIPIWGVSMETMKIKERKAELGIHIAIEKPENATDRIRVENVLLDADGNKVSAVHQEYLLDTLDNRSVDTRMTLEMARTWSTEDPYLYSLVTTLKSNGKELSQYTTPVGIRQVRFTADSGLYLNGHALKLKGVCLHDDAGSFGTAVPMAVWKERLRLLKAAGCNAVRMTHNPHASGIYDLCDQMGLLVIDEAFDEWALGKHKWITGWNDGVPGTDGYHSEFKKWWKADLTDMIRRDRNHPSVIMWSIGNEIDYPNDPYSDPVLNEGHYPQIYGSGFMPEHPAAAALGSIAKALAGFVKGLDPSRPVTAGLAAVMMADKAGYTAALDVAGYNYQEYRYEEDHKQFPHRVMYGSENGHGYRAWKAVTAHPFIIGQFLWTGVDYLGEASKWPSHGNEAGLIDLSGFKKPEYYFRQSIWSDQSMVYLGTSKPYRRLDLKNSRHGMARPVWNYLLGDTVNVYCYTNCKQATLMLNGVAIGTQSQNDSTHVIMWRIPFHPGKLTVTARDQRGNIVQDSIQTVGNPDHIETTRRSLDKCAGENQIYAIDIHVADKEGATVMSDSSLIQVDVAGGGRLIGLENGNVRDVQPYGGNRRKAYHGRLKAYIKVMQPGKNIKVSVNHPKMDNRRLRASIVDFK